MSLLAGLSFGSALFKGITGFNQRRKGNKILNNLERPNYQTPEEIVKYLSLAESRAGADIPGLTTIQDNNNLASANAVSLARESGNPLAAVSSITSAAGKTNRDLGVANAQYKDSTYDSLYSALGLMAQYKDKEFQVNEFAPYGDKYNEGREMVGAGTSNLFGALDDVGGAAASIYGANRVKGMMDASSEAQQLSEMQMYNKTVKGLSDVSELRNRYSGFMGYDGLMMSAMSNLLSGTNIDV